jgi:hypothetical protein
MASSVCVKCGKSDFEIARPFQPKNSNSAFCAIQCASCGGVVNFVSARDIHVTVETSAKEIKSMIAGVTQWANTIGPIIGTIAKKIGA